MTRLGFLERKLHDEREKALDAARTAVVEAAREWRYAASDDTKAPIALRRAVDALEALEDDHA